MDLIIDFYKELDTVNLIVFWGIIIVLILLLVFAIILVNKNKKLEKLLDENYEKAPTSDEIPVKISYEEKKPTEEVLIKEEKQDNVSTNKETEQKNTNFVAEEYVMEYNKNMFSLPNIKKAEPYEDKKEYNIPETQKTGPYQKNILRELSSNQTSPIGISKKEEPEVIDKDRALELYNNFSNTEKTEEVLKEKNNNNRNYINDVSQKLAEATKNDIERTEYEIKEEADAIISYDELMQKKDTIKTIDEEAAVISIDELMKKGQDEKIYNLTEKEENDMFIDELKHFRKDL